MTFEVHDGPRVDDRSETPTVGIRVVTPFRGMLGTRDRLLAELVSWLGERGIEPDGPFFLRLHVIDMTGDMDIEVGALGVDDPGDDRVRRGTQPAGDYAVLAYRGSSMQANRMLLAWPAGIGREFDADPESASWAGRFEIYRTDPRTERRKTTWLVELAFRLRPE
jgi:effector-binding domain-containing protein